MSQVINLPLISVIMPVYNTEMFLGQAIQSIQAQTYPNWELIIVDDGSTDSSAAIAAEFARQDPRIQSVLAPHGGRSRARNIGLQAAHGEYIAWQDADDESLPERLSIQLEWIKAKGVAVCGSCVKLTGSASNLWWFPETHDSIRTELLFRSALLQSTVLMNADLARSQVYLENTTFEDYEMWLRLSQVCQMSNIPQILVKYRTHQKQSTVVEGKEFHADLLKYSQQHFLNLFPAASAEDCLAMAGLVARQPAQSLQNLERKGQWLVRLSQSPDNLLRQYMANRWLAACHRSANLGLGVFQLYKAIAPRFSAQTVPHTWDLWVKCVLRLSNKSALYRLLAQIRHKTFKI